MKSARTLVAAIAAATLCMGMQGPAEGDDAGGDGQDATREELMRPFDVHTERIDFGPNFEGGSTVNVFTTMATWCAACRREKPQTRVLRQRFDAGEVGFFGVPTDPKDTPAMLTEYQESQKPGYRILTDATPAPAMLVRRALYSKYFVDALPGTVVTDAHGRVLRVFSGLPTYSELRRLVYQEQNQGS